MEDKKSYKILLCEDDSNLGMVLKNYLELNEYEVTLERDGRLGLAAFQREKFDLCLLDVMMPHVDGFTLAEEIRDIDPDVPLFFLSAKTLKEDIIHGYKLGADDYICKPFSPREVVARVKAVLRRHTLNEPQQQESKQPLEIDQDSFIVRLYEKKIDLTPSEFKLFAALGAKPGRVWSRAQLLDVFSGEKDVFDRTIDSHVKNIRKKIAQFFPDIDLIQSVYGIGYRIEI